MKSVERAEVKIVHGGTPYRVQVDVGCTWTKYYPQTHWSPEEPVDIDESVLVEVVEVLTPEGVDLDLMQPLPDGMRDTIAAACEGLSRRDLDDELAVCDEETKW
jgi:hypothetical protein